ncbi:hypothetical protein [Bradyrhizobium sp. AZCC 2230]|uniref:hypothetical protein n=1 Tax=Bradyrhizobium sp. AZCC 2230 TaxID=3117021 RepID=UPI002FF28AA8
MEIDHARTIGGSQVALLRALARRTAANAHHIGLYSAFAVIAAIVFGTLSVHPF